MSRKVLTSSIEFRRGYADCTGSPGIQKQRERRKGQRPCESWKTFFSRPGWSRGQNTRSILASNGDGPQLLASRSDAAVLGTWPPEFLRKHGKPAGESFDGNILPFGLLAGFFVLLHRGRGSKLQYVLLLPALAIGLMIVADLIELFDFNREPPLRAMVAALAAVVLVKASSRSW